MILIITLMFSAIVYWMFGKLDPEAPDYFVFGILVIFSTTLMSSLFILETIKELKGEE